MVSSVELIKISFLYSKLLIKEKLFEKQGNFGEALILLGFLNQGVNTNDDIDNDPTAASMIDGFPCPLENDP